MASRRSSVAAAAVLAVAGAVSGQAPLDSLFAAFAPNDVDGDGVREVESLLLLDDVGDTKAPLVLVVVEARLLPADSAEPSPLRNRLHRLLRDIVTDGCRAALVVMKVHAGPPHQDGRTLLGMRRLFQRVRTVTPIAGALLVGHFPDALLVRTCNWRRNEPLQLPGVDGVPVAISPSSTNVRCVPEIVAHRCDIVLADLDGDWERAYVPGPASLSSVTAVFGDGVPTDGVPDAGGRCVAMQTGGFGVVDVFHVRDGTAIADLAAFTVRLDAADRDHECTAADRALGNPLAQPEIAVSRIDARGVALRPEVGRDTVVWHHDAALELQLLGEYFDRNHAFRSEKVPAAQRQPAAIAHGLASGFESLRVADPAWRDFAAPGHDVREGADLVELVRWLQRPAVLRTLRAHSDPWCAVFAGSDPVMLAATVGAPSSWIRGVDGMVPTWATHRGGCADFSFYRALWQQRALTNTSYLLIHTGCEALSPPGCIENPYDHPAYGQRAHAESILFFTPCLAIVGRAKVFYDEPRGFCEALAAGATFGDAWRRGFAIEGAAKNWREVGDDIGRKRAYFWSVIGDWTLRLPR